MGAVMTDTPAPASGAPLRLFNSLTRQLEPFAPVHPGEARVYSCGPTVYNYPHIGNMRAYVFADTLGRTLTYKGYKLTHVINITDVGHLTDDADAGEDENLAVAGLAHGDGDLTVRVFQRLLKLKDADVARIAAFVMAETLAAGSAVTEFMGTHTKVNARAHWTPDTVFFDLLRDRAAVNGMIAELSGKKAADRLISAKLKDQRAALVTAAGGDAAWCPGWMRFPAVGV